MIRLENRSPVIVGAGLVGPLAALFLARRGISSTLIEKRGDLRREKVAGGRSINLAISTRGLTALRTLGLEQEALKIALPMYGRLIHSLSGDITFQPYSNKKDECIRSISRSGLSALLLDAAEKTGKVSFQFHTTLKNVDLNRTEISLLNTQTQTESKLTAHPLIGADGSASLIRDEVLKQTGGQAKLDRTEYSYKELVLPALKDGGFAIDPKGLHIWPRGSHMLIALPNLDGSFTCTLFLKSEGKASEDQKDSFAFLKSPDSVRRFFDSHFPDASRLLPNLEEEFFSNPTGAMVTVRCSQWNYSDHAILIGDAAHAILPFYGQGMNCGFEDCATLDHLIETESDWENVFSKFTVLRKPQSNAIADMAIENFLEMRDKVGNSRFLLEKSVEKMLLDRFPNEFISRYSIVTFSNLPYDLALNVGNITNEILTDLCSDIKTPGEINFSKAQLLIQQKLRPIIQEYSHEFRS